MGERRLLSLSLQATSAGRQHCICLQGKAERAVSENVSLGREREEKVPTSGLGAKQRVQV